MENLSDQEKSEILDNCKKATLLIEKQLAEGISPIEKSALDYHLTICEMCNIFMKQSAVINQYARTLLPAGKNELKLDDSFKELLQKQIEARLDSSSNKF